MRVKVQPKDLWEAAEKERAGKAGIIAFDDVVINKSRSSKMELVRWQYSGGTYFSATGNSKYIAELFGLKINSVCHSIEEETDFTRLIDSEETVGFCYPIFGSRVPRLMREFVVRHMKSLKDKKIIIFCTQMYFSGDGQGLSPIFFRTVL